MRRSGTHRGGPGIPSVRRLGWLAVLMMIAVAVLGPSAAGVAASRDTGNNGTVKIHEGGGEPSPEVKNQPHVCTFHIHFFFADAGQSGNWEIQKWAPGPKGAVVLRGTYHTNSKGEDRQPPAPNFYSLPDGHYKLFWDGDTGKHDKMKVFWVKCASTETPPPSHPHESSAPPSHPHESSAPPSHPHESSAPPSQPHESSAPPSHPHESSAPPSQPHESSAPPSQPHGSSAPPSQPGGSGGVGGATETPTTPGGGVGGATGTPNVTETLPPSDTLSDESTASTDSWRAVLIGLAALLATLLLLTPARVPATRTIKRR
jgi:hypothetical protein